MKLFVTGGTGFVGRAFATEARRVGHDVIVLARRPDKSLEALGIGVVVGDVREVTGVDMSGCDAVVHFAAATSGDAATVRSVTVAGTENCLEQAAKAAVSRFVHISSLGVYAGKLPTRVHDSEIVPLEPHPEWRGLYPQSKIESELAVRATWTQGRAGSTEVFVVRPGMIFGPNMSAPLAGTAVEAPGGVVLGLGRSNQRVPYIHVEDLAAGILGLLERPPNPGALLAFNAFEETLPTKAEIVRIHGSETGRRRTAIWPPRLLLVGLAGIAEAVMAPMRPGNSLRYKVTRYYDSEPDKLAVSPFWEFAGLRPRITPGEAVREALTIDRDRGHTLGRTARATAREHLAAANRGEGARPLATGSIVVVGAGRVVEELHLPALRALGLTFGAVVDRDARAARRLGERIGAPAFANLEEVPISPDGLGTAVIATPGTTHAALAELALSLGWHVLLEKPAAVARADFESICRAAESTGRTVTVLQNYRFRSAAMQLWRILATSDLGALTRVSVEFHMGRITAERSTWSRDDQRARAAVMELAIHFIDLACCLAGSVDLSQGSLITKRPSSGDTLSVVATGRSNSGADVALSLAYEGTAQRTRILFEFERASVEVGFFPDGCRVLPRRATPVDDGIYAATRLARMVSSKLPPHRFAVPPNAAGHLRLYRHHFRRVAGASDSRICDLTSVADTMETAFSLCDAVYG